MHHEKTLFVRDLQDGQTVSAPFLVKYCAVAQGKNGKAYMNAVLQDRSGEIECRVWEDVTRFTNHIVRDGFVKVEGRVQIFQGRKQMVIHTAQALREDEVTAKDYIAASAVDPTALYERLLGYVATMEDPHYRALAESVLRDDEEVRANLRIAPAAKTVHHAYRGGLLEHIVSITGIMDAIAGHYGALLNRDLLFLGSFFHDIGKLWELTYDKTTDYSDAGRLIGHHIIGVELIERKVRALEAETGRLPGPFPVSKILHVKHLVIAHHGKLEYGSPKEPQTLEALVVHAIDDLDSKVQGVSHFIAQDQTPGKWTALHRQFERYFYKGE